MNPPLMAGKTGIVFGVANKRSIAWSICQSLAGAGAQLALTYQNERLEQSVRELAGELKEVLLLKCDVTRPEEIQAAFKELERSWERLDFLVHSIAFAKSEDLEGEYLKTSLEGFRTAMETSAYSLTSLCQFAKPLFLKAGEGSVITLTYLGGERAVPGYNVMGVAKAALESIVRYLASDLGPHQIRVNAISAGPIQTLAARGIKGFMDIYKHASLISPMKRNIDPSEVGDAALFLASSLSRGITAEVIHVDAGYHAMGI